MFLLIISSCVCGNGKSRESLSNKREKEKGLICVNSTSLCKSNLVKLRRNIALIIGLNSMES